MAWAVVANTIRPQPGPQERFLSSPADITIYGGAAGGGKTYGLLMDPLRYVRNPAFGAVTFRRLSTQITSEGGLWDTSRTLYPLLAARPSSQPRHHWKFPSGAKMSFAHLQYDADVLGWQGAQIPYIGWDELTHFSEYQFFYMLSRNRSVSGIRPCMRATCNPDADSWVARLLAWWIDQTTGFPIPERSGVLRFFSRLGDRMIWGSSKAEVIARIGAPRLDAMTRELGVAADDLVKSITFIPSKLSDNPALLVKDPTYGANLMALPRVERERLLDGNWKVRRAAGMIFPRNAVNIIDALPSDVLAWVRRWDLAASKPTEEAPDPDWTAGVLMGRRENGRSVVADCTTLRDIATQVRTTLLTTARQDKARHRNVTIVVPQDPGQAGKAQAQSLVTLLAGFKVKIERESGHKLVRAEPFSAQWQAGNVDVLAGPWTDAFLTEMDGFPSAAHDDIPDAAAGAFNELAGSITALERARALAS